VAKSPLAIVPKKPAQAPEKLITLPDSVERVLFEHQTQLFRIKGIFASAYALAESKDCDCDVRWAMEAALELLDAAIERAEPLCIRRAAAEREVSP
jgi:hypothetical protein